MAVLQRRSRWYNLLYPMFVFTIILLFVVYAIVPFFVHGVYQFSFKEISSQLGTPSYPYDSPLMVMFSIMYLPWLSIIPGLFVLFNFPADRHLYTRFEQRIITWALIGHGLLLALLPTLFAPIVTWILD